MVLIAVMCSTAKSSMSKVEFHRVVTSRGIIRSVVLRSWRMENHSGRRIVVEFLIAKATFRNCNGLENKIIIYIFVIIPWSTTI